VSDLKPGESQDPTGEDKHQNRSSTIGGNIVDRGVDGSERRWA